MLQAGWLASDSVIPTYWRMDSDGYNVRRVLDPIGNRLCKRWALHKGDKRVWELQALPDAAGAIAQAERWLNEYQLIGRYHG